MVTDYDCWKTDEAHVTIEMVIEYLHRNAELAQKVVVNAISQIPTVPDWPCHSALKNAVLTDKSLWPAKTKKELQPILGKYYECD
jgi:5'-methylthioadenosine phosphorylase